jgi:hypothetical protein
MFSEVRLVCRRELGGFLEMIRNPDEKSREQNDAASASFLLQLKIESDLTEEKDEP